MHVRRLLSLFSSSKGPEFYMPTREEVTVTDSGLAYVIHGSSPDSAADAGRPDASDEVTVRYAGWTTDGKLFDQSFPGTATFPLSRVIKGWTEGVQLMGVGQSATFVIPPELAYGPRGAPPRIGPNATLVFRIELEAINGR